MGNILNYTGLFLNGKWINILMVLNLYKFAGHFQPDYSAPCYGLLQLF